MKYVRILVWICLAPALSAQTKMAASFTDPRDGNVYKTIQIGNRIWMAENLNYDAGDGSMCYEKNPAHCRKYGRLYTWETAKKAAPPGWHLPSKDEIIELLDALGGSEAAVYPNIIQHGSSNFDALFSGWCYDDTTCIDLGGSTYFWSSEKDTDYYIWDLYVFDTDHWAGLATAGRDFLYSVRCVKDR